MKRHFTVPLVIAASLHAVVLFGVPRSPRIGPLPTKAPDLIFVCDLRPPEITPEPEPETATTEPAAGKVEPVIRSPEPTPVEIESPFKVVVAPVDPVAVDLTLATIPDSFTRGDTGTGAGPGGPGLVRSIDLDQTPRTRLQPAPMYPFEAKRAGVAGEVWVEFGVDPAGRVLDPRVIRSSHRMFEEPTLKAVSRWVFEPGRRNGRVVGFRMTVPVVFSLSD